MIIVIAELHPKSFQADIGKTQFCLLKGKTQRERKKEKYKNTSVMPLSTNQDQAAMELQVCLTFSDMDKLTKFKKLYFCVEGKCLPFIESQNAPALNLIF